LSESESVVELPETFENNMFVKMESSLATLRPFTLAVCVRPMIHQPVDVTAIANFLVYYHSMGVSWFSFYNGGVMTMEILQLFDIASSLGLRIELNPWEYR
jgi:hypothetical protein